MVLWEALRGVTTLGTIYLYINISKKKHLTLPIIWIEDENMDQNVRSKTIHSRKCSIKKTNQTIMYNLNLLI